VKYTGKWEDSATTLYNFGARSYDAELGRFISQDPVTGNHHNPPTLHRYVYAANNPYKFVDPDGRFINLIAAGVGAAIGATVSYAITYFASGR
jgi:RHS repeat-associated protein